MAPITSYGQIVERLRRAFGLVGDVAIEPKPDLLQVINAVDLTTPGHGTYRGRGFCHWLAIAGPAAANSYNGIIALDTVVITSCLVACDTAATLTWSILPAGVTDGAGWSWTTPVGFGERPLSGNDNAPVFRNPGWVAAPPGAGGMPLGITRHTNSLSQPIEVIRAPLVLEQGDRLVCTNAAAITNVTWGLGGYVF